MLAVQPGVLGFDVFDPSGVIGLHAAYWAGQRRHVDSETSRRCADDGFRREAYGTKDEYRLRQK